MQCVQCGAPIADGDHFCMKCGAPAPTAPAAPSPAASVTTCPACGNAVTAGMKFCQHCGTPLQAADNAVPIAEQPTQAIPTPVQPVAAPAPQPVTPSPVTPPPAAQPAWGVQTPGTPAPAPVPTPQFGGANGGASSKTGKSKTTVIIAAVIAAVVLVIACIGGWWFLHRDKGGEQQTTSQSATTKSDTSDASKSGADTKTDEECTAAPDAELQSVDHADTTLTATMKFTTNCSSKNAAFEQSDIKISIKDSSGNVIAAAIFDFSKQPLAFKNGDATVKLAFNTRQYWRPYDQIDASGTQTVVQAKQTADGEPAANAGDAIGGANIADSDIERYAQLALSWQLSHDASDAQNFYSTYTTQLSSKKFGLEAEGKTWQYKDIYEQFLQLRIKHPHALMVWSSDWPTYTKGGGVSDYYVILSGESFGTTDDGSAWCSSNGYTSADCLVVDLQ
ncbi:Non-specific serine/threonine protein kinase [Bifidobacterium goeldii]|uniref:Non-specific serine/threonine protein kinase n=1 Tax=Bifidobacterium goeldii TaxID=2306975 RepID=A0A430FDT1_9BIFI|nr:zinc ribbon domain-containing protein [Bifidobacterium goeldii]RSX50996.1 Non-specific serine/threonine protein kinase [Bifidobacterium goeldii]